jgi:aerobic C4-dicarboxylate transport protein
MKYLKLLYIQVLIAIVLGAIVGILFPNLAPAGKIISGKFIDLIKMCIAPIIFFTIVQGIAGAGSLKKVGRVGGKGLLYFEVVTTIALLIGVAVANIIEPGKGFTKPINNITTDISKYTTKGESLNFVDYITHILPDNIFKSFVEADILQILFFSILFGVAVTKAGHYKNGIVETLNKFSTVFFIILKTIMQLAPIGAFAGMVFTIGEYGVAVLYSLGKLMLTFYVTVFLFVAIVLNAIAYYNGFSLWKLIKYLKAEIFIALGASSSEAVLPNLMQKLEQAGCEKSVVGLIVPAGYSFNLDGTTIYLSMATLFLAQVEQIPLSIGQQLLVIGVLMLTSKGAAGVTGSGFIVLASTLATLKLIPVSSIALLLGVDRFMSEARTITNFIGNAVATVVIAKNEKAIDMDTFKKVVEEV